MTVEERLTAAFRAADQYQPSPDLFAKVTRSIEEDASHRRRVRRLVGTLIAALGLVAIYLFVAIDRVDGALRMPFWTLEVLVTGIMIGLVLVLGPTIRRFGTAFESDIFRTSRDTGRSFLTLMDVAYYLIFGAYVLFTTHWEPDTGWDDQVNAAQLQGSAVRLGGMMLIMGLLHGMNVLTLPLIGRVFTLNRRLDDDVAGSSSA